jgi:alpha-D-xyloside xylohydrolase
MKFTDGNWMMRPGVSAHYATEAYEVRPEADALSIVAPCHAIRHRGDTLSGPALTIRVSSPLPNVIRVKVEHFQGVRDLGPHFEIAESLGDVDIEVSEELATLKSGKLTAKIDRKSWRIDFLADEKVVTSSLPRSTAMMQTPEGKFMVDQLSLGVGENVYGLGERFTAFVKNGQTVDIWNRDGGTNSEQAYKNIPFYMTNRGYGVFVNSPAEVSFEVATEKTNRVQFSVPGNTLEYFVIYGPTPKEILSKYTALTGRPALPPKWSFGLWLSTSFTTNYDEATVTSFIDGMAERDIPLGVFHYDCFWMRGLHWTDFEWDPTTFPDPESMLTRLKAKGLKI